MTTITTAFSDAVHDSQHCFRQLLKAMSEPGQKVSLDRCEGFGTMHSATSQLLLTMADNATPIWLSPSLLTQDAVVDNLRFYCGSPLTTSCEQSAFAVISAVDIATFDWQSAVFNLGTEEYPDQSTTVVVEIEDQMMGQTVSLSGPGIERSHSLELGGAPAEFIQFLQQRQERFPFPLGIDLILVSQRQVVAIPRTTKVKVMPCM
ncbi:phosphonate C-P lyase system protein PhnH [Vibrio hippocampi]|uniref:Alpha-D-ribose 1-methylphosphonate 5-triphosphate synthase subunit PhnH n=1 Tax=Vibrio hippocampi TaxID=654686 RepID=A0ABM8ZNR1_9VIBR|nr:phosphonate C-P lyase system protein PhnH [Vibrio hippocampi]CAH0530297.1 Alpha-D-ribose 1-methylphosphonate 5-triphosphate synthase subunit PhnH [Vibrio hippocampi]